MKDHASALEAIDYFTNLYKEARKRFPNLPALAALDKEFDILEVLGRERHFPRNAIMYTRWYIINGLNNWGNYLHQFILPSQQSAVAMEEYNYFDEKEKESIIHLLNWIMYLTRSSHILQLDEDDAKSAEFIGKVWEEWKVRKPVLRKVIQKNADVWKQKVG